MPELTAPRELQHVDLEKIPYLIGQEPDEAEAVTLVRSTFGTYEAKRQSQERKWQDAANLYHGVVAPRNWEGTNIPRASLAVPVSFDMVETAYPRICEALFNYWPAFFDVTPLAGTTPAEAAAVRDLLSSYLETPFDDSGLTPIAHMKMAIKQAEKYGDGVVELSWDAALKRPVVEWADIRDIYLDPTTPGPVVDWSPALIHRKLMTVEQLTSLRGVEGIKVPDDTILNWLAKSRYVTSGDIAKQREAAARKEVFFPGDLRTDPRHQQIEVLVYWTKDRLIWTLGRVWAAINRENPYGFIPYARAPFIPVEGRPHSIGIPDVTDGDQKYAQGIRNGRLDNLSLALHPPRTRAQGTPTSPGATAWRPGLEDRVADPKQVVVQKIENVTADAYREEQMARDNAARSLGINDFMQSGIPIPSNANRTGTGVSAQTAAAGSRLSSYVASFEDYMIVPLLYKMQRMIAKFSPEQLQAVTKTGATIATSRATVSKSVQFQMKAASRMLVKERLAMFLGPVSQLLFNEAVVRQANLQGRTLDFAEWERFFQDATGTSKSYAFFREMTPQEAQAAQQPDTKTMADMQKAMLEAKVRMGMGQMKLTGEREKIKADLLAKTTETGEASARKILEILQKERSDAVDSGTEEKPSGA